MMIAKSDPPVLERRVALSWPDAVAGLNPDDVTLGRGWFSVEDGGNWSVQQMVNDLRGKLIHARCSAGGRESARPIHWDTLIFQLRKSLFLMVRQTVPEYSLARVWARSLQTAEKEFRTLRRAYFRERERCDDPNVAEFYVLTVAMGEPQARRVTTRAHTHTADDLQLHYGQDFLDWHLGFLRQLKTRGNGLTVLQGEPGVGKTSYLRSLMAELRLSHKFFYIPITSFGLLATPACTDFWLAQNERHKALRSVCVIEDGDMLLAKRGADNQQLLSDLLNLSDGFLADTLRVQIIVTVNSEIDQLDPAVVRPGRLQAARKFRRLSPAEAEKIAAKRKLKLPPQESYSLGEIYNAYSGAADTLSKRAGVGFMHL